MREATGISIRRACRLAGLSHTTFDHEPKADPENQALTARMIELAQERRRFGYRRIHVLLRREGVQANHKRVHRLYRMAGLAVRRRRRRERVAVERQPLLLPGRPNEVWSMDFVMDRLEDGRRLKVLTVVDDFTKEAVEIALDHGMGSNHMVHILERSWTTAHLTTQFLGPTIGQPAFPSGSLQPGKAAHRLGKFTEA